jgi:hypothetical protein
MNKNTMKRGRSVQTQRASIQIGIDRAIEQLIRCGSTAGIASVAAELSDDDLLAVSVRLLCLRSLVQSAEFWVRREQRLRNSSKRAKHETKAGRAK